MAFATHLHPLYDLPEDGVPAIEVGRGAEGDEELRPVRVRPRIGHRKQSSTLVRTVHCGQHARASEQKRRSSAELTGYTPTHRRSGKVHKKESIRRLLIEQYLYPLLWDLSTGSER